MRTEDFDFELPRELVAQAPLRPRDGARLLHVSQSPDPARGFHDRIVRDLPSLLRPGDIAVFNNTRVIPARLFGYRDTVRVEATLHRPVAEDYGRWRAFARPGKRLREGDRLVFAEDLSARVAEKLEGGEIELVFDQAGGVLLTALDRYGRMPLPPYIRRDPDENDERMRRDREDYQTVYARYDGAVAAPTAGLHFTPELLSALEARGVERAEVTLHVGAGTFLPVKAEKPEDHEMHPEPGTITEETAERINAARAAGGRVLAVGTTSLRLLETACDEEGRIRPFRGESRIYILPGRPVRSADLLMTNFHLPKSTLFMLVSAFAGTARMKAAYAHAIRGGYRFYSYGDSSLLERDIEA